MARQRSVGSSDPNSSVILDEKPKNLDPNGAGGKFPYKHRCGWRNFDFDNAAYADGNTVGEEQGSRL